MIELIEYPKTLSSGQDAKFIVAFTAGLLPLIETIGASVVASDISHQLYVVPGYKGCFYSSAIFTESQFKFPFSKQTKQFNLSSDEIGKIDCKYLDINIHRAEFFNIVYDGLSIEYQKEGSVYIYKDTKALI